MIDRSNRSCKYFPCHDGLEDCTFCYCPFYPCEDGSLGEFVATDKTGGKVWSCQRCVLIHKNKVVDKILKTITNNISLKEILIGNTDESERDRIKEF